MEEGSPQRRREDLKPVRFCFCDCIPDSLVPFLVNEVREGTNAEARQGKGGVGWLVMLEEGIWA